MVFGPQLKRIRWTYVSGHEERSYSGLGSEYESAKRLRCRVRLYGRDFRIRFRGLNRDNVESGLALVKPRSGSRALLIQNVDRLGRAGKCSNSVVRAATSNKCSQLSAR